MAAIPNVLFVLFDGLWATVIDSQVLAHVREMQRRGVARFEIWAVACAEDLYQRSLDRRPAAEALAEAPVRVLRGVRPAAPLSVRRNARILAEAWGSRADRFDCLHARTEYAVLAAAPLARAMGAALVYDCRGDAVAEVEYRYGRGFLGALARDTARRVSAGRCRKAAALADRAVFVSEPLKALLGPGLGGKPSWVIPSGGAEHVFFFDPGLRRRVRATLGYGDADIVLVYSGGLAPYQCFPETVRLFTGFHAREPASRLLLVTPDPAQAEPYLRGLPRGCFRVVSASFDQVNGYLNAADAAFMLRQPTATNRVAAPTKFAEYGLAGLPVIMTDAVEGSVATARALGNLVAVDLDGDLGDIPHLDRAAVARAYRDRLSKGAQAEAYRHVYGGTAGAGDGD